jgi:hypothetical protein
MAPMRLSTRQLLFLVCASIVYAYKQRGATPTQQGKIRYKAPQWNTNKMKRFNTNENFTRDLLTTAQ